MSVDNHRVSSQLWWHSAPLCVQMPPPPPAAPTGAPTAAPTYPTATQPPSVAPNAAPTAAPVEGATTAAPTATPVDASTASPAASPTAVPSKAPTGTPSSTTGYLLTQRMNFPSLQPADTALYTGKTKLVIEIAYAVSIGIYEPSTRAYHSGCTLRSEAILVRRAEVPPLFPTAPLRLCFCACVWVEPALIRRVCVAVFGRFKYASKLVSTPPGPWR